uniref:Uncharacterized protein n=1 Tax=Caenorhabditis japonica TaxID=281687 RepID=A0A8R1HKB3_CAEJA
MFRPALSVDMSVVVNAANNIKTIAHICRHYPLSVSRELNIGSMTERNDQRDSRPSSRSPNVRRSTSFTGARLHFNYTGKEQKIRSSRPETPSSQPQLSKTSLPRQSTVDYSFASTLAPETTNIPSSTRISYDQYNPPVKNETKTDIPGRYEPPSTYSKSRLEVPNHYGNLSSSSSSSSTSYQQRSSPLRTDSHSPKDAPLATTYSSPLIPSYSTEEKVAVPHATSTYHRSYESAPPSTIYDNKLEKVPPVQPRGSSMMDSSRPSHYAFREKPPITSSNTLYTPSDVIQGVHKPIESTSPRIIPRTSSLAPLANNQPQILTNSSPNDPFLIARTANNSTNISSNVFPYLPKSSTNQPLSETIQSSSAKPPSVPKRFPTLQSQQTRDPSPSKTLPEPERMDPPVFIRNHYSGTAGIPTLQRQSSLTTIFPTPQSLNSQVYVNQRNQRNPRTLTIGYLPQHGREIEEAQRLLAVETARKQREAEEKAKARAEKKAAEVAANLEKARKEEEAAKQAEKANKKESDFKNGIGALAGRQTGSNPAKSAESLTNALKIDQTATTDTFEGHEDDQKTTQNVADSSEEYKFLERIKNMKTDHNANRRKFAEHYYDIEDNEDDDSTLNSSNSINSFLSTVPEEDIAFLNQQNVCTDLQEHLYTDNSNCYYEFISDDAKQFFTFRNSEENGPVDD